MYVRMYVPNQRTNQASGPPSRPASQSVSQSVCMHICMYICIYVCRYMYVCMFICIASFIVWFCMSLLPVSIVVLKMLVEIEGKLHECSYQEKAQLVLFWEIFTFEEAFSSLVVLLTGISNRVEHQKRNEPAQSGDVWFLSWSYWDSADTDSLKPRKISPG